MAWKRRTGWSGERYGICSLGPAVCVWHLLSPGPGGRHSVPQMLTRIHGLLRLCLGGVVWGCLLGTVLGSLLGAAYGAFHGDVTLGLDGAVLGCLILGLLGGLYGGALAIRSPPFDPPLPGERMPDRLDVRG
jgi:hypothetical protein